MIEPSAQYLTPEQLCKVLNIKISNLRSAVFYNRIPYIKIGRLLRFDPIEINKWIDKNRSID